jgi:hypothetical protein
MAHFARLDKDNIVQEVLVVNNDELLDENGNETEQKGKDFCNSLFGGHWIQTSFNSKIRKNFAGVGFFYNEVLDAFVPPQPFASWIYNEINYSWDAPTPMPTDVPRFWNEKLLTWEPSQ